MSRRLLGAVSLVAFVAAGTTGFAAESKKAPPQPNAANIEIHVLPVRKNVYMLVGGGGSGIFRISFMYSGYMVLAPPMAASKGMRWLIAYSLRNGLSPMK